MLISLIAISAGASAGAMLRWLLGLSLNSFFPAIAMGTLTANLLGGYLIGVAMALFIQFPDLSPQWRLLIITGFLGSLTTFSAFSAEVVSILQQGRLLTASLIIGLHVLGSLAMTMLGLASVNVWRG